ncbi:MAG TPA: hypothetical protein VMV46_23600 [Thermoanaerobaculia bacterium]|nr:hypothetical protein [Thermoanaerobaculia bacterium]
MSGNDSDRGDRTVEQLTAGAPLYFFPDEQVTERQLREILESGTREQRCRAVSHLLRFAQWDDIWLYVTRDEVRELFNEIELPESLRTAWARMLKVEAPVG